MVGKVKKELDYDGIDGNNPIQKLSERDKLNFFAIVLSQCKAYENTAISIEAKY